MSYRDLEEVDAIQKEEALRKISAMIKRYDITAADLQAIVPDMANSAARKSLPEAKLFDPFFDVR
jgi:hypothetical protein